MYQQSSFKLNAKHFYPSFGPNLAVKIMGTFLATITYSRSWSHIFYHALFPGPQNTKPRSPSVRSNGVSGCSRAISKPLSLSGLKERTWFRNTAECYLSITANKSIEIGPVRTGCWFLNTGFWIIARSFQSLEFTEITGIFFCDASSWVRVSTAFGVFFVLRVMVQFDVGGS